jgi:hypothetical protein
MLCTIHCGTGERAGKANDILEAAGLRAANSGSYGGILHMMGNREEISAGSL